MKIGIIGCGKMSQALFGGAKEFLKADDVYTYTPTHTRAVDLAKKIDAKPLKDLYEMAHCELLFICCKPQQFKQLGKELEALSDQVHIVSLMAGINVETIKKSLNVKNVIRTMPNTPSQIKEGVTLVYSDTKGEILNRTLDLFKEVGLIYETSSEDELDFLTGFTGSGPAYVFEFIRIFSEKMKELNIDERAAQIMMAQTFLGAAKLVIESDETALQLRENVTSKNGVTFEALKVFQNENLQGIVNMALDQAYNRAKKLSKECSC